MPKITVDQYDRFYEGYGFKPLEGLDYSLQEGYEKVVLYGFTHADGERYETIKSHNDSLGPDYRDPLCYHAIVQKKDGTWSSKMGRDERIRVLHPGELGGGRYGRRPGALHKGIRCVLEKKSSPGKMKKRNLLSSSSSLLPPLISCQGKLLQKFPRRSR